MASGNTPAGLTTTPDGPTTTPAGSTPTPTGSTPNGSSPPPAKTTQTVPVKVSVGPTTWIGWGTAIVGAIPIIWKLIEEGQKGLTLSGPEKWFAIISVVGLAITQIGRYVQSIVVAQQAAKATFSPPAPE